MKVKIVKATEAYWWYVNHIGEVFEVVDYDETDYRVISGEREGSRIYRYDIVTIAEAVAHTSKKPHKWTTEIHAFADGCKIQSKPLGCGDWSINNNPNWGDVGMEYRVSKGPEFPQTQLEADFLMEYYCEQDNASGAEDLKVTVDMALQHFVESGQMAAYIKECDNANN